MQILPNKKTVGKVTMKMHNTAFPTYEQATEEAKKFREQGHKTIIAGQYSKKHERFLFCIYID